MTFTKYFTFLLSRYQHLLLPNTGNSSNGSRPGSIQETPLPPLPMKEPIYQELSEATLLRNNMTKSTPSPAIRVSFNDVNKTSDDEEEFLKPTNESSATGTYVRYTFSSNQNIPKSWYVFCFWASDPLI